MVVPDSAGGGYDLENLVSLCAAHHLHSVHMGFIRVRGKAPDSAPHRGLKRRLFMAGTEGDAYGLVVAHVPARRDSELDRLRARLARSPCLAVRDVISPSDDGKARRVDGLLGTADGEGKDKIGLCK